LAFRNADSQSIFSKAFSIFGSGFSGQHGLLSEHVLTRAADVVCELVGAAIVLRAA
jgi:hypothetical protein